jgi:hypothetical protein
MTCLRKRGHVAIAVITVLAAFPGAAPAVAQSATNSAGIEGRVTDESGGALPGVAVTITSAALQARQMEAVTDDAGRYRFTTLPGGEYTATFTLTGFRTVARQKMNLDAGFVATVDVRMALGAVEETLTVVGESPLVDVRTTTEATNIKKELMETIPTSRAYADVGKLAPGVRLSGLPDVGGSQTGGQRGNLVSYGSNAGGQTLMLDGVNTDGTGGYFDFGAIEEMIVRPGGNDAEIPTSGMAFQIITKSGGNTFHGDGLAAWQGQRLQSNNIDDELRSKGITGGNPMEHYYDMNGSLGGRIVRDRLWFFGSGRRKEYQTQVLGYSGAPGPDGVYFTPDDEQGTQADRESNGVIKLSGQPALKHRLSWMDQYGVKATDDRNASSLRPHEAAVNYSLPVHTYKGDWTYTPSDRGVLLVSIGRSWYKSEGLPYSDLPSTFDTVTQRWGGATVNSVGTGDDAAPAGSWSQRWQYDANYTYYLPASRIGTHELKVGGSFTREWYRRTQEARSEGRGGAGQDYRLYYSSGAPIEVLLYNSPFTSENNVNYQGGFIRDNWRIGDRLTLNVGMRFERYDVFLPEQSKPAGLFSAAADYPHIELYDWRAISPRIGMSYALTADNRTVVKATYGRFNHAIRPSNTTILRNLNGNEYEATRYRWNDRNANRLFEYPGELGDFIQTEGGSTTRGIYNPEIEQPRTDEATLRFERQLGPSLSARVGYVYKREFDLYQLVNVARPFSAYNIPITTTDPGPDGVVGNADDRGPVTYFDYDPAFRGPQFERNLTVNPPGLTNRYNNIEVGMDKRLSANWQLLMSYLATKNDAWIAGVPTTPNEEFFPKNQTWDQTFRAAGSYVAPWGIMGSALFEYQSGPAQARDVLYRTGLRQLSSLTLRMEPIGAYRLPAVKLLSVRAAKHFRIGAAQKMTAQFDLFNALNANDATAITVRSGPNYDRITAILPPRVARVGVTYSF